MTQYKMIFSDIDGTLLNSQHQVTENTKRKIQELDKKGVPFVLVSARKPDGVWSVQEEIGIKAPIVSFNGALIHDTDGTILEDIGFSRDTAIDIKVYINERWADVACNTYSYNQWIVDDDQDPWVAADIKIIRMNPQVGGLSELLEKDQTVHKILCMGPAEEIEEMEGILSARYPDLSIYRSKPTYLEIVDKTIFKSNAVKKLCKVKGIPLEETVSFGDNYNDLDMIQVTGLGYAMANSPEDMKKQVEHIALDNDSEGLLKVLEQLSF